MSKVPETDTGRQLWRLLPEVYRNRDNGDLAEYLDGCGVLLDRIKNTLHQRLADAFADIPDEGRKCQDWLLPYIADLFDVRLVSPDADGRREEVALAVGLRQRKGTLASVETIAQSVAQTEVEIQEGWRRTAVTPRMGHPRMTPTTIDFRNCSRAVRTTAQDPESRLTRFGTEPVRWRQANPNGRPCFPGSFEDVSRRTVDLRSPDWRRGHVHPRRLLLFAPPPAWFFASEDTAMPWTQRDAPENQEKFQTETDAEGRVIFRGLTHDPLPVKGAVVLEDEGVFRFENIRLENSLTVKKGYLELRSAAAPQVRVFTIDTDRPVIDAKDSLLGRLQAARGLSRLEYVTVLGLCLSEILEASDSIFMGPIHRHHDSDIPPEKGCIRYSRIPQSLAVAPKPKLTLIDTTNTVETPLFFSETYGDRGCGVLHPGGPAAVRFGAEDGGEMGACHARHLVLRVQAALSKLNDFLPLGMSAVWIDDPRLNVPPPEET